MSLIFLISRIETILEIIIIIRMILTWFPGVNNSLTDIVYTITEPILSPFRKYFTFRFSGMYIDLSPIIVIFIMRTMKSLLIRLILGY